MFETALQGWLVAISLILAIGAQNAFVLRQGLRREHVAWVVAVCAISDAILIAAGVAGFSAASKALPWLGDAMRWGGVAFLLAYGALRFRAALRGGESLAPGGGPAASLGSVLGTCLGALLVTMLTSGLLLLQLGEFWVQTFLGLLLLSKLSCVLNLPLTALLVAVKLAGGRPLEWRLGSPRWFRPRSAQAGIFAGLFVLHGLFASEANYEVVSAQDLPLEFDALDDVPEGLAVRPYLRSVG